MNRSGRQFSVLVQASGPLLAAASVVFALMAAIHLNADEPHNNPGKANDDPMGGSWLFDWVMSGQEGFTGWKQVRMSREGKRIHLERLMFEDLEAISETTLDYEVVDEWRGGGQKGVLLLQERESKVAAATTPEESPEDRFTVWVYQLKPDRESALVIFSSPSLLDDLATPDEKRCREVFEKNKLALIESRPAPLFSESAPIPFQSRLKVLESAKLPALPIEDSTALATLFWRHTNPFSLLLTSEREAEPEGGALGALGVMAELLGTRDHASFVDSGFSPLSGRVARLYWDGGDCANPIMIQRKFESGLRNWLNGEPGKKDNWAAEGEELAQFREKVTTAFKKGDPELIMALFEWNGVDQFSKDSEYASWRALFNELEYETESVQMVRPDEVFRRWTKLDMEGWSAGGIKYHPNVETFGAVSINLAPVHIQIPFGKTGDGKWALAGIVCDRAETPDPKERAHAARPDSMEALYVKFNAALRDGDVETIMELYEWKGYTPFQKDRERFSWTQVVAVLKAEREAAKEVSTTFIASQKHLGLTEAQIKEDVHKDLDRGSDEDGPMPETLEELALAWVTANWEDMYPRPQPDEVDGSNFGFEVEKRRYNGAPGEMLLFRWRLSSNESAEPIHLVGASKAQDGSYVLCPVVLPKRIREDFNRLCE